MKKLFLFLLVIVAIAAMPKTTLAQTSTTADVTLKTPLVLTKTAELHFGTLMTTTAAGTCALSTAGARTPSGGVSLSAQTTVSAAAYSVSGEASAGFAITLPADGVVTVSDGGGHSMNVNSFVAREAAAGADGTTGTLSGAGAQTFTVGATLVVGASQATGSYTGTFNVSVDYN